MGKKHNAVRKYNTDEVYHENHVIGQTGEHGKIGLSKHSLSTLIPKTANHANFVDTYMDSKTEAEAFVVTGYPGTAKTYLAMWLAFADVFDITGYHNVTVFRSPVESRDTGFKPGTEEEKGEVFEKPYKSLIYDIFPDAGPSTYNFLKEKGVFKFELTSNQRGVTFNNTIMIIDEVQNMDYEELKTIITRKGHHSKIILCGDFDQDDLQRDRRNAPSGLKEWMEVFKMMGENRTSIHSFYEFDDIVRDGWVRDLIITEIKKNQAKIKQLKLEDEAEEI